MGTSHPAKTLTTPALARLWTHVERTCAPLKDVAHVGSGLTYKPSRLLPANARTTATDYFYGAVRGYNSARDSLSVFRLSCPVWMSIDGVVIARAGEGTKRGTPRVLLGHAPASRLIWRTRAAVDHIGSAFSARFYGIQPRDESTSLRLIAALLNGPVANAYLRSVCGGRGNLCRAVKGIPIPAPSPDQAEQIEAAVRAFEDLVSPEARAQTKPSDDELRLLLARIDALVLDLYGLPRSARRRLLRLFAGLPRPGLTFDYELSEALLKQGLALEIPPRPQRNPWLEFAGMWADDPTWDEFMAELARIRKRARG